MMPEWHHSDFSRSMYVLPESTKKKLYNQVPGPPKIRPNSAGLLFSFGNGAEIRPLKWLMVLGKKPGLAISIGNGAEIRLTVYIYTAVVHPLTAKVFLLTKCIFIS